MSKIEFLVQKAHGGLTDVVVTSRGEWYRKTYDMRLYITRLHLSQLFYVLNTNELGMFFTIVNPLAVGRSGDYEAAWIFIPSTINVLPHDLVDIVARAQQDMMSGNDNYDDLRPMLNNVYPDITSIDYAAVRPTSMLAYRLYGPDTDFVYLGSLLEKGIDQGYYRRYQAVFFINRASLSAIPPAVAEKMVDLSRNGFEQPAWLFPPQTPLPGGIEVEVLGRPFRDMPLKLVKGNRVNVTLHRPGFNDLTTVVTVSETRQPLTLSPDMPWEKVITSKMFNVVGNGHKVQHFQMFVNGTRLLPDQPVTISEKAALSARIEVMASGFADYDSQHNLLGPLPVAIHLLPKPKPRPVKKEKSAKKRSPYGTPKFIIFFIFYTLLMIALGISIGTNIDMKAPATIDDEKTDVNAPSSNAIETDTAKADRLSASKHKADAPAAKADKPSASKPKADKPATKANKPSASKPKADAPAAKADKPAPKADHPSASKSKADAPAAKAGKPATKDDKK